MKSTIKLILLSCIISCVSCEDHLSNSQELDNILAKDSTAFSSLINSALEKYTNYYEYDLRWEEIEYNETNPAENEILYYHLDNKVFEDGTVKKVLYLNNNKIGEIETDNNNEYVVYYIPISGEKFVLYDFSNDIENNKGLYLKYPYSTSYFYYFITVGVNSPGHIYPAYFKLSDLYPEKYKPSEINCVMNLFETTPTGYMLFTSDLDNHVSIVGIGSTSSILSPFYGDNSKQGYKKELIQFSYFDKEIKTYIPVYVYDIIRNPTSQYIPKEIWREEFVFELVEAIPIG